MRTDASYSHLLRRMTIEMVDSIFASFSNIERLHGIDSATRRPSLGLFGGEPLLADNRAVIAHILHRAQESGVEQIWAVSNGTELDAYVDLLGPGLISKIQITLDGRKEVHDRRRIYADGSGSFDRILNNIDLALSRGTQISVRMNIDRANVAELPHLAMTFKQKKWTSMRHFSAYIAAVHGDYSDVLDTWELSCQYEALKERFPEMSAIALPDDHMGRRAKDVFVNGGRQSGRESFCGAHAGMYIFDPFADIYACWEKTGEPEIKIGHVNADSTITMIRANEALWRSRTVASNPACRKCRYSLHCGGGCAVAAYERSGQYHSNYCDGFASRFRSQVATAYRDFVDGKISTLTADLVCDL